jgi:hypothetical protein
MSFIAIAAGIYLTGAICIFSHGMYEIKVDIEKHKTEGTIRVGSGDVVVPVTAIFWPLIGPILLFNK